MDSPLSQNGEGSNWLYNPAVGASPKQKGITKAVEMWNPWFGSENKRQKRRSGCNNGGWHSHSLVTRLNVTR